MKTFYSISVLISLAMFALLCYQKRFDEANMFLIVAFYSEYSKDRLEDKQ